MRTSLLMLFIIGMVLVCCEALSEEKHKLPEEWRNLASEPDDQILLNSLFEKVSKAGNNKSAITSLLINDAEKFKSKALKRNCITRLQYHLTSRATRRDHRNILIKFWNQAIELHFRSEVNL